MIAAAQLSELVGRDVGVSDWIEVSQPLIDRFADTTMDRHFIHVEPRRAGLTRFAGTIAHGFLSLSLLTYMSRDILPRIENEDVSLNYGLNGLRFPSPVRAGERIRGRFVLGGVEERSGGQLLQSYDVTVEIEGGERPALVARWLVLTILRASA